MVAMPWIVSFEYVSPERHPEHYCRCSHVHPVARKDTIAAEHWTPVSVTHTNHSDAVAQFRNLKGLQREGHFIRAVSLVRQQDLHQYVGTH
jgi:hypothetical protein